MRIRWMLTLFLLLILPSMGLAGYSGPTEIIEGRWGSGDLEFGFEADEPWDSFPGLVRVDESGKVIIGDGVNFRIKIYGPDGVWQRNFGPKRVVVSPIGGWPANLRVKAGVGIFSLYKKLQKYDYTGSLVWTIDVRGFVDFWVANDGGIWFQEDRNKYLKYSPTGRLLRTYTQRPLELGVVREEREADGNYKLSIKYPDRSYEVVVPDQRPDRITRDVAGNLYVIQRLVDVLRGGTPEEETIQHYRVIRYDCCKELGRLDLPEDEYEVTGRDIVVGVKKRVLAEYGEPVISPNGDIYTWKRTPESYYILKWTWQD